MKIALLTCAVFPTEEDARKKMWIFLRSCEHAGTPVPHLYGAGNIFPGYRMMKLEFQLEYLRTLLAEYTHVLYTDGWDAFFTGPWGEVMAKYKELGMPPILTSAYSGFADTSKPDGFGDVKVRLRYPHVGGYIAELPAIVDAFEKMLKLPEQTGDDSFSWRDAWLEGWFRPVLDSACEIFQVTDEECGVHTDTPRLYNHLTGSFPCVLHLAGGYTDQVTGKDDRMIPWAEKLGVIA